MFDKFEVRMRFSKRKSKVWESDFSKNSRACGAPFFGNAIFYRNSISVFFPGIAVFISKLDIRAWANPAEKKARADANNFFNFGWTYSRPLSFGPVDTVRAIRNNTDLSNNAIG